MREKRLEPTTAAIIARSTTTGPSGLYYGYEIICLFDLYYIITFYYIRAVRVVRAVQIRHVYYRKYVNYTSVVRVM